jgi:hypothetical protein
MKRLLILGVALSSMGNLVQCPTLVPPESNPPRCDDVVAVTPPGSCFELPLDPCTHRRWTIDADIDLNPLPSPRQSPRPRIVSP